MYLKAANRHATMCTHTREIWRIFFFIFPYVGSDVTRDPPPHADRTTMRPARQRPLAARALPLVTQPRRRPPLTVSVGPSLRPGKRRQLRRTTTASPRPRLAWIGLTGCLALRTRFTFRNACFRRRKAGQQPKRRLGSRRKWSPFAGCWVKVRQRAVAGRRRSDC